MDKKHKIYSLDQIEELKSLARSLAKNRKIASMADNKCTDIKRSMSSYFNDVVLDISSFESDFINPRVHKFWAGFNFLTKHLLPYGSRRLLDLSSVNDVYDKVLVSNKYGLKRLRARESIIAYSSFYEVPKEYSFDGRFLVWEDYTINFGLMNRYDVDKKVSSFLIEVLTEFIQIIDSLQTHISKFKNYKYKSLGLIDNLKSIQEDYYDDHPYVSIIKYDSKDILNSCELLTDLINSTSYDRKKLDKLFEKIDNFSKPFLVLNVLSSTE